MEGEPHEPEEAVCGKVLLLLHATELGKNSPAHHRGLQFCGFCSLVLMDLTPSEPRPPFLSQTFQVKEMDLIHLFSNVGPQLGGE